MALDGTYSGLLLSIASFANRDELAATIPDFVTLFESNANTEASIRTQFNRTYTVVTTVASLDYISTPADYLGTDALLIAPATGTLNVLKPYGGAAAMFTDYPDAMMGGLPKGFINLTSKLQFAPTPDAAYATRLYYYQKIPALATYSTNWLLTNYPQIYLFGSLVAMESFLGNDDVALSKWGNLYDNAIQKLGGATDRNKYGGSSLQVAIDAVA